MKKIINKKYYLMVALIILLLLTHLNWFNFSGQIFSWDLNYWHEGIIKTMFPYGIGAWLGYFNFGSPNVQPYFNSFFSIWGLIGNHDIAIRTTFLIPIIIFQVIGPYLLLKKLFNREGYDLGILLGSLFFVFNSNILYLSFSHIPILFIFSITPLMAYLYLEYLEKRDIYHGGAFVLFLSLCMGFELRITILMMSILFIFTIYAHKDFLLLIKSKYIEVIILGVFLILLNAYWLIPMILGGSKSVISEIANRGVFGNNLTNILYAITGYKPYWNILGEIETFKLQAIPTLKILLVGIIPLIFILNKKWSSINITAIFLVLVSILLLKQDGAPFVGSYTFFYENIPAFNLFREGSKFSIFYITGFMILISGFYYKIEKMFSKRVVNLTTIFLLISILLTALPLFLGKIGYTFQDREFHQEYTEINNMIEHDNDYYKVLYIPKKSKLQSFTFKNPVMDFMPGAIYSNLPDIKGKSMEVIEKFLSYEYLNNFLDIAGVKYIVFPFDDSVNQDFIHYYYGDEQKIKSLGQQYLTNYQKKSIGRIDVYTNTGYLGPIFKSENIPELSIGRENYSTIDIDSIQDNIKYSFNIHSFSGENFINLSQNNSSTWDLSVNDKSLNFLKEDSLTFLNTWKLDTNAIISYFNQYIPSGYPIERDGGAKDYYYYMLNADGTIDMKLVVYFKDQDLIKRGFHISWITLVFFLLFFLIAYLTGKK